MRRIKTFLKKYYFPILTEAVVLCIIIVLSYQIVSTEKDKVWERTNRIGYLESFAEYEGDNPINGFFSKLMIGWGYSNYDTARKGNSCYGINIQLYDSNGNLIADTPPRFLAVECWPYSDKEYWPSLDEEVHPKHEVIFLDDYFSTEDLDKIMKSFKNHSVNIETMTGYYENNTFIPVEIFFSVSDNRRMRTYTLTSENADKEGKILETKYHDGMVNEEWYSEEVFSSTGKYPNMVSNWFHLHFLNTRPDIQEKMQQEAKNPYASKNQYDLWEEGDYFFQTYYGTTTKQNNLTYRIVTCVDATALAWYAALDDTFMVPMWILCQGLGLILIAICMHLQKRQQKLDEMRDTFLNAIAHEMKTPAAVIKNSSECIQAGIQPEKHKHYMEIIEKEADRMNHLLNNMLTYTRTNEAKYELNIETCDMEQLARNVFSHYETIAQQKDIHIQWNTFAFLPSFCDKELMRMVLDNFFSNAIKFCPAHGNILITLRGSEFLIYNDGPTFSDENKKQIWEPLFKIDTARTEEENSSSGMGLAIASSILKLHHADYGVENKENGVEFYFKL